MRQTPQCRCQKMWQVRFSPCVNTSQMEFAYLMWLRLIHISDYLRAQIKVSLSPLMWNVCLRLSELTAIEKANAPTSVRKQHGAGLCRVCRHLMEPSAFKVSNEFSLWHTHTHTLITLLCLLMWKTNICLFAIILLINSIQSIKVIRICLPPIISLYENVIYLERRCEAARYDSCSKWIKESKATGLCSLNPSIDKL